MIKKNGQGSLKPLLFIVTLALFLYLPLKAEDKEYRDSKTFINAIKPKNNINSISFAPFEIKLFVNSEILYNPIKEYKPYSTILNFPPIKDKFYLNIKKNYHKQINLRRTENTLFIITLVTFATLNVADFYSANKALKFKCLKEANPLLRPLTKNTVLFATVKLGITAFNCHLLKKLYKKNKIMAWTVCIASNFVMGYIVINNFRLINKVQSKEFL